MSAWKDFVTAALLGTERGVPTPGLPAALAPSLVPADEMAREAAFLTRAGALALWRRAGWKLSAAETPSVVPAPVETAALVNAAGAAHVRAMLGGHCADVLPEWLAEAARRRRRIPPELLPALLDWAKQSRARRPVLALAGGARARWLAAQNPEWNFATDDSPEHWETGSRDQRAAILRAWRAADPAQAREKLAVGWNAEPAEVRAVFLALLADGLCGDDAPLLESALDDRSKEVRAVAVDLLCRLPDSPFAARMMTRATPLLVFKPGKLLKRASLEVTLPGAPDAAAQRDGLDPKLLAAHKAFGEKAALLVLTLAAVPLSHWKQTCRQEPGALLKAVEKHEYSRAVATGWAWAAVRQRDTAWAEALLEVPAGMQAPPELVKPGVLSALLPESVRAARLAAVVRQSGLARRESWPDTEALIRSFPDHLPVPVAQDILHELRLLAGIELPWHLRYSQGMLATKIPPRLLPFALDDWPEQNHAAEFVNLLAFRRDALAALAQS